MRKSIWAMLALTIAVLVSGETAAATACGGCPEAGGCTLTSCLVAADDGEVAKYYYMCDFGGTGGGQGYEYDNGTGDSRCIYGCSGGGGGSGGGDLRLAP